MKPSTFNIIPWLKPGAILLLLTACTPSAWEPGTGDAPEEAELRVTHAQVLTGMAKTRADLKHSGGTITIVAYDNPSTYWLDSDGNLTNPSDILTMPRTSQEAKGLTAYGYLGTAYSYNLPVHATAKNYEVNWEKDIATLKHPIELSPAVAALNITLKDANNVLAGFDIITQGKIYTPMPADNPNNWTEKSGTYQINPDEANPARGREGTNILVAPTDLNHNQSMLEITGRIDAPPGYPGKTWTANVPLGLTQLLPGKRYKLTVTLNGERASIAVDNINDWETGTGKYLPNGYDVAVYTWEELKGVITKYGNPINVNIIQMADIVAVNDEWSSPSLSRGYLYNGNGYTITGLDKALFGYVQGWVYNTHLRDSEVLIDISSGGYCGLLAESNRGVITLCSATGSLKCTITDYSSVNVGGLVGWNDGAITRSYTDVAIMVSNSGSGIIFAGGLAGYNSSGTITACATFGKIEEGTGTITAGNVVGYNNPSGEVYYSYALASGDVIGYDRGIYSNTGPCPVNTLVKSTADRGIDSETRSFDREIGTWWIDDLSYSIDFTYEGE